MSISMNVDGQEVVFHGESDDRVKVAGVGGEGVREFEVPDELWGCALVGPDGKAMSIHMVYEGSTWHVAIGQRDEDTPYAGWPVRIKQHYDVPHSVVVRVEVPDGTRFDVVT